MVQAAALPWRRTGDRVEILLVTSRATGRWILPKGWQDTDELLYRAAEREAWEEAGIEGTISQRPVGSYFYTKSDSGGRRCQVQIFPLEVSRVIEKWPEKGIRDRRWLSPSNAARRVAEPALAEIIEAFSGIPPDLER